MMPTLWSLPGARISIVTLLLSLILSFSACAKRVRQRPLAREPKSNEQQSGTSPQAAASDQTNARRVNINTASVNELEALPGVGKGLAARIIEHREKWGGFRRPEHLIAVRGISDRRFRTLRDLITVE